MKETANKWKVNKLKDNIRTELLTQKMVSQNVTRNGTPGAT